MTHNGPRICEVAGFKNRITLSASTKDINLFDFHKPLTRNFANLLLAVVVFFSIRYSSSVFQTSSAI
jgi:hypothetical protein